jgi:DNA-binding NarL/FixJ family response regulator
VSCRVLIVEDDDPFAEILSVLLEVDGRFAVVGRASNGAEGIELARELAPDVITMDIDMPRTDGVQATAAIRQANPASRIVVVSGSVFVDRVDQARAAGASGYVAKSRAVEDLAEVLLAVCRGATFVAAA